MNLWMTRRLYCTVGTLCIDCVYMDSTTTVNMLFLSLRLFFSPSLSRQSQSDTSILCTAFHHHFFFNFPILLLSLRPCVCIVKCSRISLLWYIIYSVKRSNQMLPFFTVHSFLSLLVWAYCFHPAPRKFSLYNANAHSVATENQAYSMLIGCENISHAQHTKSLQKWNDFNSNFWLSSEAASRREVPQIIATKNEM